ncbi:phage terminase large subunit-like protein [Kaistia hirudinis]|uniref:Phage terminase large subunit-like protein n=1 Tax=Kaistia hirudinis TaxID=1293440 RepID=A0A840ANX2_9HYPH|nr:phage terminase large subunit-like protein [Kaistia hirudinis]
MRNAWNASIRAGRSPAAAIARLSSAEIDAFAKDWDFWARDDQLPPAGDWLTWLMIGGRGAGKTRAGAEWVRAMAAGRPGYASAPAGRIALVGETLADVRDVMIEGVSGLLAVHRRDERPLWQPSRRRLEWPNGAYALCFSSEDPESLRGPQFEAAWADELGKWRHGEATWDMLQFGLRLGDLPRQLVTTTPRTTKLMKRLIAAERTVVTRAGTGANLANLAPGFLERVLGRYKGTRLGRQEIDGELIEDRADALWSRDAIEALRVESAPELQRIAVAVDPPASRRRGADACGIVACGLAGDGTAYVLADRSVAEVKPAAWAAAAVGLYRALDADILVAEVNQGGDMVASVIGEVDPHIPVTPVRATRGKYLRAEPVAALYAQGRVRHAGTFPQLEDELADFGPEGLSNGRSPDRLDALVWALTALMLKGAGEPRVRMI